MSMYGKVDMLVMQMSSNAKVWLVDAVFNSLCAKKCHISK